MSRGPNSFIAALAPTPYVILGLRLLPFALGHYIWLRRFGCQFVADDEAPPTREDLVIGCLVCSMRFAEFAALLQEGNRLPPWRKAVAAARFLARRHGWPELLLALKGTAAEYEVARWGAKCGLFDVAEKSKLFADYIAAGSVMPKYWVEREAKRESGGDWAQSVLLTLTSDCGFTAEQAYDMPLREAFLHFFRAAEKNGAATLMTDEELELTEETA